MIPNLKNISSKSTGSGAVAESHRGFRLIDWSLSYALRLWRPLFLCFLFVYPVQLLIDQLVSGQDVQPKQFFFLQLLGVITTSWQLVVISMVLTSRLRGEIVSFTFIGIHAIKFLPKTALSLIGLMSIIFLAIQLPPLLLGVLYLMWAPFFVALELSAKGGEKNNKKEEKDKNYEAPKEASVLGGDELRVEINDFKDVPLLSLGLVRSSRFAANAWRKCLLFSVLIWGVNVIPQFVLSGFGAISLESSVLLARPVSGLLEVFVIATAFLSLILGVPEKSLKELALDKSEVLERLSMTSERPKFRFLGAKWFFWTVFGLSVASTASLYQQMVKLRTPPQSLEAEVSSMDKVEEFLVVKLRASDFDSSFRWLEPGSFFLKFESEPSSSQSNKSYAFDEEKIAPSSGDLKNQVEGGTRPARLGQRQVGPQAVISSSRKEIYDLSGERLFEIDSSSERDLVIKLFFPFSSVSKFMLEPAKKEILSEAGAEGVKLSAGLVESKDFEILFSSPFVEPSFIASGRLSLEDFEE